MTGWAWDWQASYEAYQAGRRGALHACDGPLELAAWFDGVADYLANEGEDDESEAA